MNELRQSIMLDSQLVASKSRFGLFSQPPSTAIGDDSPYKQKRVQIRSDGKPITLPRNMLAGSNRSGVGKKSFIQPSGGIYLGDKYLDPQKIDRDYFQRFHSKHFIHENDFLPSSGPKTLMQSPYMHVDENPLPKIKPARDDTGRVITKDRNFTTNSMSKVEREVFKHYKYIADPIDRKSVMQSQERKLSKQKRLPELFRSMSHGDILFSSDKRQYGIDNKTEELIKKRHEFTLGSPVKVTHEANFKLARKGHGDPLGRYPQFLMPNNDVNAQQNIKIMRKERDEDKYEWRHNGNKALTRPTPSISCSSMNLRKYY